MTTYYRIADWDRHYEVDAHGHAWRPGKAFRNAPIGYVRNKARGRSWSRSALALRDLTDSKTYAAALGTFGKVAELVACSPRAEREGGVIRNRKGKPATIEEIAWMIRMDVATLEEVFPLLTHPEVEWLEAIPEIAAMPCQESQEATEGSGDSGTAGNSGSHVGPTDKASGSHVGLPEKDFGAFVGSTDKSCRSRVRSRIKRSQGKEPEESPDASETSRSLDGPCDDPGLVQTDDSHDLYFEAGFDSTRLSFLRELRSTLRLLTNSDHQAVINFERWLHERISGTSPTQEVRTQRLMEVVTLARDCQNGDSPIAVFLSRARAELGYVPPSRKPKGLELPR
jgi:hypothetical protein